MQPITNPDPGAVRLTASVPAARQEAEEKRSAKKNAAFSRIPPRDEYVPEAQPAPTGRYWPGQDEEGRPKLFVDGPRRAQEADEAAREGKAPEEPADADGAKRKTDGAAQSRKAEEKHAGGCRGSTDKVDREIRKLKEEREKLTQQLERETDGDRRRALENRLAQIERALREKDNDTYRRSHMEVSFF